MQGRIAGKRQKERCDMLFVKLAGCILILFSTSGIGFLYAGELVRRQEDLCALKTMAIHLRGEIRYAMTALPEAVEHVAKRHDGRLKPFLTEISKRLSERNGESMVQIWTDCEEKLKVTSLTKKDKLSLHQLGESLGYLDKEMQLATIDLFLSQTEEAIIELAKVAKERKRLYQSLGILSGAFLIILIL